MKVLYLELENFKGIYDGLGRKKIILNFEKNISSITILSGENGSGKSTILSMISPMPESFDQRKDLILENCEGYKNIVFQNKDDIYDIKHHYLKNGNKKCFISKNNIELNDNGGVRTFNTIINTEFGIDDDFFQLCKLGSNAKSFVKLNTSDRKKFINKILPNVDDFLRKYDLSKEKVAFNKKEYSFMVNSMNKIGDIEILSSDLEMTNEKLFIYQNELDEIKNSVGIIRGKIENIQSTTDYDENGFINFENIKNEINDLEEDLKDYYDKYSSLENYTLELCDKKMNEFNSKLVEQQTTVSMLEDNNKKIKDSIYGIEKDIENKNIEFKKFNMENIDQLIVLKNNEEIKIKNIRENMDLLKEDYVGCESLNLDNLNKFKYILSNLKDLLLVDIKHCLVEEELTKLLSFNETYNLSDQNFFIDIINKTKMNIRNNKENHDKTRNICSVLERDLKQVEILTKRPTNCKIDSCPFIIDAIKYKELPAEIAAHKEKLTEFNNKMLNEEKYLNFLIQIENKLKQLLANFNKIKDFNFDGHIKIEKYLNSFSSFLKLVLETDDFINHLFSIDELIDYLNNKNMFVSSLEKLENINSKIELIKDKNRIMEVLRKDIITLQESIISEKNKIEDNEIIINDLSEKNKKTKTHIHILDILKKKKQELSELKSEYDKIEIKIFKFNEIKKEIDYLTFELNKALEACEQKEEYVKILSSKEQEIKALLINYRNYNERKSKIENEMGVLEKIKLSLDPTKGIPLLFIDNYLKETKIVTNELLDIAYNNNFRIGDFIISESDFKIPIIRSMGIRDDISICSQGEIAMVGTSLSLALIKQNLKAATKYNIITLDEVDSELDENNRSFFVEIMLKQIEALGIENVFIITHNNQFDYLPTNVILLKGSTSKSNDNNHVIFSIGDTK